MSKSSHARKFENVVLNSIDAAFSSLGENVKRTIYFHLDHNFMIAKKDIPYKIDEFSDALEQIFGLGARHLELLIMKNLHERVECSYKWEGPKWLVPDLTFRKYVHLLKVCYEDNRRIGELEVVIDAGETQEQRIQRRE